jgi:exodeoxyribonuclease VII large subunit
VSAQGERPAGLEGSGLKGPFPVGEYAAALRGKLRALARVQVFGEVANARVTAKAVYFELRDVNGALPCSMWRSDYDRLRIDLEDGMQVVLGGGCDYYAGSSTSSPSFTFRGTALRVAGEGELLAQIERLRRKLHDEGLFEPQKLLPRPALPRSIGVVTGEGGKARDDVLAGLRRRGWEGRLVWAFAPVQDRRAAPAIARALGDLAAVGGVGAIVVARGGGSIMDLMAFSDETLCRTVAMLPVPVIASVGHHTDRTLIDDVAAVSCSTPTHAAETAVAVHVGEARGAMLDSARRLDVCGRRGLVERGRRLRQLARAPADQLARQRGLLHQKARELRAAGRRGQGTRAELTSTHLRVLARKAEAAAGADTQRRRRDLSQLSLALAAHDPERTLARGYALVEDDGGGLVTSAAAARTAGRLSVRFHDDRVRARVDEE